MKMNNQKIITIYKVIDTVYDIDWFQVQVYIFTSRSKAGDFAYGIAQEHVEEYGAEIEYNVDGEYNYTHETCTHESYKFSVRIEEDFLDFNEDIVNETTIYST